MAFGLSTTIVINTRSPINTIPFPYIALHLLFIIASNYAVKFPYHVLLAASTAAIANLY